MSSLSEGNRGGGLAMRVKTPKGCKGFKTTVIDIPIVSRNRERRRFYDDVISKLITLESHKALRVEYKELVAKAQSAANGLRMAAKRKKITISTYPNEDHLAIWRIVNV